MGSEIFIYRVISKKQTNQISGSPWYTKIWNEEDL